MKNSVYFDILALENVMRPSGLAKLAFAFLLIAPSTALAVDPSKPTDKELRAMLLDLKKEQQALNEKIDRVEALLENKDSSLADAEDRAQIQIATPSPDQAQPEITASSTEDRLNISGDLQLRYEGNFSDNDAPVRNRGVMRARLRAEYAVNSAISVGAELSTGSRDDPNTVHVTLSDFVDDFEVSLSRLYAKIDLGGGATLIGGKFANPFTRTDLVWDGDVNPQGATAIYAFKPAQNVSIKAAAIYSIIDEASAGPDSDMLGGQINVTFTPQPDWRFSAAASYYDYSLDNLSGADAGDFRSNLRDGMGGYLSDFDLLDILASVTYSGFGERWPLTINGDYVKNYGATAGNDEGYSAKISLGRASTVGDWRFAYGYSQVGIDAVLGAFSNDNMAIATNYQSHLFGVDYTLFDDVVLNATLYHYKPLEAVYAGVNDPDDWLDRLRLNMTIGF